MSEFGDIISETYGKPRTTAMMLGSTSIDDSPEEAMRAIELGETMDIPPSVVATDLPNYERQSKATMASQIIANNPAMIGYLNRHPMASKVSNDDYGTLDIVSQRVKEIEDTSSYQKEFLRSAAPSVAPAVGSLPFMAAGASLGAAGLGAVGTAIAPGPGTAIGAGIGAVGGALIGGIGGAAAVGAVQEWLVSKLPYSALKAIGLDPISRAAGAEAYPITSFIGGMAPFALMFKPGGGVGVGERVVSGAADAGFEIGQQAITQDEMNWKHVALAGIFGGTFTAPNVAGQAALDLGNRAAAKFTGRVSPYIAAGKEPPAGLDPILDELKAAENEMGLSALDSALAEAMQSTTRERSPDLFASFLSEHGDSKIELDIDAVRALYGENIPAAGDGILGFVPNLNEQLAAGIDVTVPMSEWLARVDPAVAAALRDDTRVRPGALTKNEAVRQQEFWKEKQALEQMIEEPSQLELDLGAPVQRDPVDLARGSAALEPLLAAPGQKFALEVAPRPPILNTPGFENFHDFNIRDQFGKLVGYINLSLHEGGKKVYIEDIAGLSGFDANSFGYTGMKNVLDQIKVQFPEVEVVEGVRVSGAREKADSVESKGRVQVKLAEAPSGWDLAGLMGTPSLRQPKAARPGTTFKDPITGYEIPVLYDITTKDLLDEVSYDHLGPLAKIVHDFFGERFKNTVGDIEIKIVNDADLKKLNPRAAAFYDPNTDKIVISENALMEGSEAYLTELVHHEATHAMTYRALRQSPEIEKNAFKLLQEATDYLYANGFSDIAETNNYFLKNVDEFFSGGWTREDLITAYSLIPMSPELAKAIGLKKKFLQGQPTIWDGIKELVAQLMKKLLGAKPSGTVLEGMFELGRQIEHFNAESQAKIAGERQFAPDPFAEAAAVGMTVEQHARYLKKIAERQAQDQEAILARAVKEQKKRQTKEWKDREAAVTTEVEASIHFRPDIAALEALESSMLFGEKLTSKPKLAMDLVPDDVRAALPEKYFDEKGLHPDDLANLVGYRTADELYASLVASNASKATANQTTNAYVKNQVTLEVERQMARRFGRLDDNIITEAQDQILSETQVELLHEETLALAVQSGLEFSIPKKEFKEAILANFRQLTAGNVTVEKFLAQAGKYGKAAELALLRDDPATAFQEKQRQYMAIVGAQAARAFEKQKASFDKLSKRFVKREVPGVEQEYTNFIHQLMAAGQVPVRRDGRDILDSIAKDGNTTLEAFVARNNSDGWEIHIPDSLAAGDVKPVDEMTVEQFGEYAEAIQSLAYVGREVKKIEIAGAKADFAEWKEEVLGLITTLKERTQQKHKTLFSRLTGAPYRLDAELVRVEEIVKDLDLRRELGPLFNALIRPMMDAKHKEYQLQEQLVAKLKEIHGFNKAWQKTLDQSVPQNFLMDPKTDRPFDLTRGNMLNIMMNFGNRSNIEKFTRGYSGNDKAKAAQLEIKLRALFDRHATKEDWDYVNEMWKLFEGWRKESDTLYHNISGIAPRWLEHEPIETRFGTYPGGYFPVIYDKFRSPIDSVKSKKDTDSLFQDNYYRATTSNGYTKGRRHTGWPIEFEVPVEQLASRMYQQIHDIAYRSAVMQAGKIIYDKDINAAIIDHYGKDYADQFVPWLKDIANYYNQDDAAVGFFASFARGARLRVTGHALGLNIKVLLSPEVGQFNPKVFAKMLIPGAMRQATDLAMEKSKEIPHTYRNMDRDYREMLERTIMSKGWQGIRADAVRWSFLPMVAISQRFRIMTFVEVYQKGIAKGLSENDAAVSADAAIRLRHGATGLPDMPSIMRGSEFMKMSTVFYGFFNAMYQGQRQLKGNLQRGEVQQFMLNYYTFIAIPAMFGAALFNDGEKDESWFKTIGKALTLQPLQTIPFVREAAGYFGEGFTSRTPWTSIYLAGDKAFDAFVKVLEGKPVKRPIQTAGNVIGLGLGLPLGQASKSAQFTYDALEGRERPKNILDWIRGITYGTLKEHK